LKLSFEHGKQTGVQNMLTQEQLKAMTLHQIGDLIREECPNVGQYGEEYLAELRKTDSALQEDSKLRATALGANQALSMATNSGAYRSPNSQAVKNELVRRFKDYDKRARAAYRKAQKAGQA
jgi:hypothetical protein